MHLTTIRILIADLCNPDKTLQIDSRVLESAEAETEAVEIVIETEDEDGEESTPKLTKKQQAELLRQTVDTVGKEGEPGEQIQNVISVGMLSEGWDAKNSYSHYGAESILKPTALRASCGKRLKTR